MKRKFFYYEGKADTHGAEVVAVAMWASESMPFDGMEKALHKAYLEQQETDQRNTYTLVEDYPLSGQPPMMTHVYEKPDGRFLAASKGAPEAIIAACKMSNAEVAVVTKVMDELTSNGYRLLGVACTELDTADFPLDQWGFDFAFVGLVAFYDPPKANIREVLSDFRKAGIEVKVITGDNLLTTRAIAQQVGLVQVENGLIGAQIQEMTDEELSKQLSNTAVFARMFPEGKLRIINLLKKTRTYCVYGRRWC